MTAENAPLNSEEREMIERWAEEVEALLGLLRNLKNITSSPMMLNACLVCTGEILISARKADVPQNYIEQVAGILQSLTDYALGKTDTIKTVEFSAASTLRHH